jgi:hypothetical protein
METKRKTKDISGWYAKERMSEAERLEKAARIEAWYENKVSLNYRTVPVEVPGRMLAALGSLAMDTGQGFSEFIEAILEDYLEKKGIQWQE